jgi:hypothetical protein
VRRCLEILQAARSSIEQALARKLSAREAAAYQARTRPVSTCTKSEVG